jgi:hypothetical protein
MFPDLVQRNPVQALINRVDKLERELADAQKDADRYRYIAKSELYVGTSDFYCSEGGTLLGDSDENNGKASLDAYIDAAIKESK